MASVVESMRARDLSSTTTTTMTTDRSSSSPISSPNSSTNSNHIVGPNGQHYTQGEAARLGLIIRTACESCRNRKLKCSGTLQQDGGCQRCSTDALQCVYSARAPIGRPKKRPTDETQTSPQTTKRKTKPKKESSSPTSQDIEKVTKSCCSSKVQSIKESPSANAHGGDTSTSPASTLVTQWSNLTEAAQTFSQPNVSASTSTQNAGLAALDAKLPSLDDLSIAAFLQSLDTLEISPEELLQQQQQQSHQGAQQAAPYGQLSTYSPNNHVDPRATATLQDWTSGSAILQPGLSFAVPADFSWWDLGIMNRDAVDSACASLAATPSIERPQPFSTNTLTYSEMNDMGSRVNVPSQPENIPLSPSRKLHLEQNWPRGVTAGMGQGQIQQTYAASEGGLGWSTFAVPTETEVDESAFKPAQIKTEPDGPPCCSHKKKKLESASPAAHGASATAITPAASSPLETKPNVQHQHPSKVHCVPNPSGKGCTCLCDMSVALLSVKQVLRETDPSKQTQSSVKPSSSFASNTIQLTLTASQAITAQCACSTDCPTCQSDPSTEISASLLVSTALQIYARAVRILREGFSSAGNTSGSYSSSSAANAFFGGLEVTIGSYKPSSSNAKKIALFAIKLELKDLRKALGKVSRMAQDFNMTDEERGSTVSKSMNPIDQLVIFKLYRQLTELLKTVEGLEEVA